jgi:hypothetical protein
MRIIFDDICFGEAAHRFLALALFALDQENPSCLGV